MQYTRYVYRDFSHHGVGRNTRSPACRRWRTWQRRLFGKPFAPEQVVNEKLTRSCSFNGKIPTGVRADELPLKQAFTPGGDGEKLKAQPVASLAGEHRMALDTRDGDLVRGKPRNGELKSSPSLSTESNLSEPDLPESISNSSCSGSACGQQAACRTPAVRYTLLPFKLHQFISQTGSVYTTLDQDENRFITLEPGVYKADEEDKKPIFSNLFSRASGHAFICVSRVEEPHRATRVSRELRRRHRGNATATSSLERTFGI
jgi:hypothetical protein